MKVKLKTKYKKKGVGVLGVGKIITLLWIVQN